MPNTILTPHIAAATRQAKTAMSWVVRDVVAVLQDEGVVRRSPTSQRDLHAVQDACNGWCEVVNRRTVASHHDALVLRWEKPVTPTCS